MRTRWRLIAPMDLLEQMTRGFSPGRERANLPRAQSALFPLPPRVVPRRICIGVESGDDPEASVQSGTVCIDPSRRTRVE